MSLVTFHCPHGPFEDDLGEGSSLFGEVSLQEHTARQLLAALSLQQPGEILSGSLPPERIPHVLRRLLFVMNTPAARKPFLRASKKAPKPRVIDCPNTGLPRIVRASKSFGGELSDAGVMRRLEEFHNLLRQALEFECHVHWG